MGRDWARYWRSADRPLEAMHAHFVRHAYHRHSHETYSFGVTEDGAQSFTCRGGAHTSVTGMVMAFNPDDPHDGQATDALGFTYRIVHIGPELITDVLEDAIGRRAGLPLFAAPVVDDPVLAGNLRALHAALLGGAPALRRDELLAATVSTIVQRAARTRVSGPAPQSPPPDAQGVAERVREILHSSPLSDVTADALAAATGRSRFAVYRAFQAAYGMSPSDYQRQLRLRRARALIAAGRRPAEAAARAGFADQAHLTRWFTRYYGVTPGIYRHARTR